MIETREALADIDDILAVPGHRRDLRGPSDLSIALSGGKALNVTGAEVEKALDHALARAKAAGKIAGAYAPTGERAAEFAKRGFSFIALGSDTDLAARRRSVGPESGRHDRGSGPRAAAVHAATHRLLRDTAARTRASGTARRGAGLAIDAVADAGRQVPFARHVGRREGLAGDEQRVERDEVVLVAMDQEDRRL